MKRHFRKQLVLSAACIALCPAWAAAQDAASSQVDEIVVTARKTNETIVQAPLAVTALSAENLEQKGISGYQSLSDFVPGFKFNNQSVNRNDRGFTHFTIRGMYSGGPSPDRQAASAFIDGVPIGNGSIAGLADVAQVEVIKGPQSAYFGRSTFSGAINFVTRDPSFDRHASIEASYASFNTGEVKASLEGGIIPDVLAGRLSVRRFHTDGQYKNALTGENFGEQDTLAGSISLVFTPTPNFRAKVFGIMWEDDDGSPSSGMLAPADMNCITATGRPYFCGELKQGPRNRLIQQTYVGQTAINYTQGVIGPGVSTVEPGFQDRFGLHRQAYEAHGSFEYDLPADFTVNGSASTFRDNWGYVTDTGFTDARNLPNPFFGTVRDVLPYTSRTVGGQTHFTSQSAELRITSPEKARLRGMLGVSYFQQKNYQVTSSFQNSGFAVAVNPQESTTETVGLFGSLSFDITEALTLSLEGRMQRDSLTSQVKVVNGLNLADETESFSPRAILRYEVSPDQSVYISYAKGTRPSAFNSPVYSLPANVQAQIRAQFGIPLFVPEEKVWMAEVGFKSYFLDRRLRVLAAAYTGVWSDKHIAQTVTYFNPTLSSVTAAVPGGEVDLRGIELEGSFRATEALSFDGTFAYTETEIKNTACSECLLLQGSANPVGNRLPFYPAYTASLGGTYTKTIGDYEGFLRADYVYTGRIYESESNLAWTAPAHKLNLRAGVERDNYKVELFGDNILDNEAPTAIASAPNSYTNARTLTFSPAQRRVIGIRASAKY